MMLSTGRLLLNLLRCASAIGLIAIAPVLSAGPITTGTWHEFGFADAGTPATGCDPADPAGPFCIPSSGTPTDFLDAPPWTFLASALAFLTVTDAFSSGDQFELFDFGASIGLTSLPVAGIDCGDDPVPCLATVGMSSATFALAAGAHSITLTPTLSQDGGAGYLLVQVPEPGSLALVALALFAVLVLRLRRARGDVG